MSSSKDFVLRWLPLILWMVAIFVISDRPKGTIPDYGELDFLVKKGGHLLGYCLLAVLTRRAGFTTASTIAFVLAYALSDELHQRYVPGRTGSVEDILIDLLGALLGLLGLWLFHQGWRVFRWDQTDAFGERSPHDV